jgi:TniQ
MDWPLMLRPLPRPVAPFRDEMITSYLHRLAGPNHIDPAGLRCLLAGSDRTGAPVPLGRLAVVAGMPWRSLAYAMPQICTPAELTGLHVQNRPRARDGWSFAACRPCTAGQPVTRWALHDDIVCCRHRRWISKDHEQPDLTGQPEILHAHRWHRWLIRRHGRDPVMRALRDARHICIGWRLDVTARPGGISASGPAGITRRFTQVPSRRANTGPERFTSLPPATGPPGASW